MPNEIAFQIYSKVYLIIVICRLSPVFECCYSSIIHRLIASTISAGAATVVAAVLVLISFLIDQGGNGEYRYISTFIYLEMIDSFPAVATGVLFCLGRVYALTLLYNLNKRESLNCLVVDNETCDTEIATRCE
jgi:hypothetical protein